MSGRQGTLPVDPERLRREFPDLTSEELDAFVAVTRSILEAPAANRAAVTRQALAAGRAASEAAAAGEATDPAQRQAMHYLSALAKTQPRRD